MNREKLEAREQWRPIPGWDGLYEASDLGRVRSLPRKGGNNRSYGGRVLKLHSVTGGYLQVSLRKQRRHVHQLVMDAFIGPRPPGQQVRHGPGGKFDNRLVNLRYGTPAENEADKIRDGTDQAGSRNGFARLTESAVEGCRRRYAAGETYAALAAEFGVDLATIALAVKGKTWRHVQVPVPPRQPKTHCPAGHPYSEANTYQSSSGGSKQCRACRRDRDTARVRDKAQHASYMREWRVARRVAR